MANHLGHVDNKCDCCKKGTWGTSLVSDRGRLYLCNPCADEMLEHRASKSGHHQGIWQRLVSKVLGSSTPKVA